MRALGSAASAGRGELDSAEISTEPLPALPELNDLRLATATSYLAMFSRQPGHTSTDPSRDSLVATTTDT